MKKQILSLAFILIFFSCGERGHNHEHEHGDTAAVESAGTGSFGEAITEDGAILATEIATNTGDADSVALKVTGKITDVCQKKGCWMMVDIGNGKEMRVTFKDYGFFVPKDAAGKTAVIDGYAYKDTVPVEALKHYAEESGKPQSEIDAITEPEIALAYEARGVIIKE
ncbi:MAG: DUF4920 domain-containing protein [Bacteroidetes bacterium]|nr:DUF4920 domain-containing protein [Bacteroidota bacterium]